VNRCKLLSTNAAMQRVTNRFASYGQSRIPDAINVSSGSVTAWYGRRSSTKSRHS